MCPPGLPQDDSRDDGPGPADLGQVRPDGESSVVEHSITSWINIVSTFMRFKGEPYTRGQFSFPRRCSHLFPADPLLDLHTTDERSYRGKVGIKMFNLQLSFKARNSKSNSNSDKFKMCLIFKVLSFKEGSATPCPSTTPVQWCSTRTRSRSRPSTPRRSSRWTG